MLNSLFRVHVLRVIKMPARLPAGPAFSESLNITEATQNLGVSKVLSPNNLRTKRDIFQTPEAVATQEETPGN